MSKTYCEQFDEALACTTKAEADEWLNREISRYGTAFGKGYDEAKHIILINLGYMAGYYNHEVAQKINQLFGATHPIFGGSDYHRAVSPEQAFQKGVEAGKASE